MTSYLRDHVSKLWLVAFSLPVLLMLIGADSLVDARQLLRAYQAQVGRGGAVRVGDMVVVTGRVQATPVVLPDRFPAFGNALMVVKQYEERHRQGKRSRWQETRKLVWMADTRSIGGWQLDNGVIEHGGFDWFRASPCTDYEPPVGWVASCAFGNYAKRADDSSRRFSYIVTPIPDTEITLIAIVSSTPGTLTAFMAGHSSPVAFIAAGEWSGSALLEHRLNRTLRGIGIAIALAFLIAWLFSYRIRRRMRYLANGRTFVGDLFRAVLVSAPYAGVFLAAEHDEATIAVLIAALVSSAAVLFIWLEGRKARQRGW